MKNHNLRLCIVFIFMIAILILISCLLIDININFEEVFKKLIDKIGYALLGNVNKQNMLLGILGSITAITISCFLMLTPLLGLVILCVLIHGHIYKLRNKVNRIFFSMLNLSPIFFMIILMSNGLILKSKILVDIFLTLLICLLILAISGMVIFIFKKQKVQ